MFQVNILRHIHHDTFIVHEALCMRAESTSHTMYIIVCCHASGVIIICQQIYITVHLILVHNGDLFLFLFWRDKQLIMNCLSTQ